MVKLNRLATVDKIQKLIYRRDCGLCVVRLVSGITEWINYYRKTYLCHFSNYNVHGSDPRWVTETRFSSSSRRDRAIVHYSNYSIRVAFASLLTTTEINIHNRRID